MIFGVAVQLRIITVFLLGAFAASFLACAAAGPAASCTAFRKGDFIFRVLKPEINFSFLIHREGGLQTEINQSTGAISKLAIKWTDACHYEMRLLESTEHFSDSTLALRKRMVVKTEILTSTPTYYTFRASSDNSSFVLVDTLWLKK
jgi:hypothetical protein